MLRLPRPLPRLPHVLPCLPGVLPCLPGVLPRLPGVLPRLSGLLACIARIFPIQAEQHTHYVKSNDRAFEISRNRQITTGLKESFPCQISNVFIHPTVFVDVQM